MSSILKMEAFNPRNSQIRSIGSKLCWRSTENEEKRFHSENFGPERVAAAVRAYESEQSGIEINLIRLNWFEQAESLRDGRVDVGLLRQPFDSAALTIKKIGSEPSGVCLPATCSAS